MVVNIHKERTDRLSTTDNANEFSSLYSMHMLETCSSGIPKQKNSYKIKATMIEGINPITAKKKHKS